MSQQNQNIEELKNLIRYYYQASHEFFDDVSHEVKDRLESYYGILEKTDRPIHEYKQMVEDMSDMQANLKKKVDDLGFLTSRMNELFKPS